MPNKNAGMEASAPINFPKMRPGSGPLVLSLDDPTGTPSVKTAAEYAASLPIPPQGSSSYLQLQLANQMMQFAQQQSQLLQQALPFILPYQPSQVLDKLQHLLDDLNARPTLEKLRGAGYTEVQAQRACFEYCLKHGKKKLDQDKVRPGVAEGLGGGP